MKKEDCFYLGRVLKPFSYKGEVSLFLDVDTPAEYEDMDGVYIDINGRLVFYEIETLRLNSNKAVVRFAGVGHEDLDKLIGRELYLPMDLLPELDGNNFYFHEVIGFEVEDEQKGRIGRIEGVYENTMQPLLSIDCNGREILLPAIDPVILEVRRDEKLMKVRAPEGLIDMYLQ